jgi:hypothetical protein
MGDGNLLQWIQPANDAWDWQRQQEEATAKG